jgi:hypothetical protein
MMTAGENRPDRPDSGEGAADPFCGACTIPSLIVQNTKEVHRIGVFLFARHDLPAQLRGWREWPPLM